MLSSAECRKRAAKCELLAGEARTPKQRDELLALAQNIGHARARDRVG
jgi:hypothetical protein